jgi:succinate dehydrogenase / fumarate reductase membrane anchor subunit
MMRDQKLWTWHILAGGVILVLLGMHMTIMHLDKVVHLAGYNPAGGRPIDWANVVARGKSAFMPVSYVLLLGAALFHGLYGLRNILLELNPAAWLRKAIGLVLLLGGLGLFAFGSWVAVASHASASSPPAATVQVR